MFQNNIQSAINAALDGDTIVVVPESYKVNLNFKGKNKRKPRDSEITTTTIINADQKGACLVLDIGETNITIPGFTLTNGSGRSINGVSFGGTVFTKDVRKVNLLINVISNFQRNKVEPYT